MEEHYRLDSREDPIPAISMFQGYRSISGFVLFETCKEKSKPRNPSPVPTHNHGLFARPVAVNDLQAVVVEMKETNFHGY